MAKRFTDKDKWDDSWFCDLSNDYKLLWLYLLDKCDTSGVYKVNKRNAEYALGFKINWEEWEKVLDGRIHKIDQEKWFIPKFIKFQYGELSPSCKPHIPIIAQLKALNLLSLVETKGYPKGINTLNTIQDNIKDNTIQETMSLEKYLEGDNLKNLKSIYKNDQGIKDHLVKTMGFAEVEVDRAIGKVF